MRLAVKLVLLSATCIAFPLALLAAPRHIKVQQLPADTRELYETSMKLAAESFDSEKHLIPRPSQSHSNARGGFMVRESSWYALGLLARDQPGDRALAATILETVLNQQYRTPGKKWYGTFKRTPEEPEPAPGTIAFTGYDPNWRHFIGTTFQMILIEYPDRIPAPLRERLYASIDLAINGELQDGRLKETYSNIALMYGALWDFAAAHNGNADWKRGAAAWNEEVNRLYRLHNTFFEFNSPTYYGVDIYGLALWREYGSTERMRTMGADMEASLWNDIADFYQPSLRNISGPYDRSYGMDMESYVAVTGLWLRSVLPAVQAPLPEQLSLSTDHMADLWLAPQIAILSARIPAQAMKKFRSFTGPHQVTRTIDDKRVATAWVGEHAIWGGEATSLTKDVGPTSQFHPATVQWRTPSGRIGWVQLTRAPNLNATADRDGITIETKGDVTFRIVANGVVASSTTAKQWNLPGMPIAVESDGAFSSHPANSPDAPNAVDVTYSGVSRIRLQLRSPGR
jgi:hypothetical protein